MCAFSDLRLTVRPRSLAQEHTIGRVSSVIFCREEIVCNPQGLDDFNGNGYFYVRSKWTGFGFQANIVEEYVLLSASLHLFVGLKRTWDQKLSSGVWSGQLNLAITGLILLTFISRSQVLSNIFLRPPPTLINWHPSWLIALTFFTETFHWCPSETSS